MYVSLPHLTNFAPLPSFFHATAPCPRGQYRDSTTRLCVPCTDGCQFCASESLCYKCIAEYFWDESASKCTHCPDQCMKCHNATSCDQCASGYTWAEDGQGGWACMPCSVPGCADCSGSIDTCSTCASGYTFTSGSCAACGAYMCAECDGVYNINLDCDRCAEGFGVDRGYYFSPFEMTCQQCNMQHCVSCEFSMINQDSLSERCLKCAERFEPSGPIDSTDSYCRCQPGYQHEWLGCVRMCSPFLLLLLLPRSRALQRAELCRKHTAEMR